MNIFARNKKIKIRREDLNDAKMSSASFSDVDVQKRAFLNVLGARLAINALFNEKIEVDNLYSLYTVNLIRERLDIADIFYNDLKIDVRVIFNEDEIFVPKTHKIYDIEPDVYAVLKLENFEKAEIIGYFTPKDIDITQQNDDYYFVDKSCLVKPKKLKNFLGEIQTRDYDILNILSRDEVEYLFITLADKQISDDNFKKLIYSLYNDITLRERLSVFENFEFIAYNTSNDDIWKGDNVLDVVGAQNNFENVEEETLEEAMSEDATRTSDDVIEEALRNAEEVIEKSEMALNTLEGADLISEPVAEEQVETETISDLETEPQDEVSESISDEQSETAEISDEINLEPQEEVSESIVDEQSETAEISDEINLEPQEEVSESIVDEQSETAEISDEINLEPQEEVSESIVDEQSETAEISDEINLEPQEEVSESIVDEQSEIAEISDEINLEPQEEVSESIVDEQSETAKISDEINLESQEEVSESIVDEQSETAEISDEINLEPQEEVTEPVAEEQVEPETAETSTLEPEPQGEISSDDDFELGNIDDLFEDLDELSNDVPSKQELNSEINSEDSLSLSIIDDFETLKISEDLELNETEKLAPLVIQDSEPEYERPEEVFEYSFVMDTAKTEDAENIQNSDETVSNESEIQKETEEQEKPDELPQPEQPVSDTDDTDTANIDDLGDIGDIADLSELDDFFGDDTSDNDVSKGIENVQQVLTDNAGASAENKVPDSEKEAKAVAVKTPSVPQVDLTSEVLAAEKKSTVNLDAAISESINSANNKKALTTLFAQKQKDVNKKPEVENINEVLTVKNLVIMTSSICLLFTSLVALGTFIGIKLSDSVKTKNQETLKTEVVEEPEEIAPSNQTYLTEPITAKISNVTWEVPESLAYNDVMREYLQLAGKNIKLNLQNELILTTEYSYSERVVVDLQLSKAGNVSNVNVSTSSGSKGIDHIIVNTIKETIKYLKVPDDALSENVNLSLVISF